MLSKVLNINEKLSDPLGLASLGVAVVLNLGLCYMCRYKLPCYGYLLNSVRGGRKLFSSCNVCAIALCTNHREIMPQSLAFSSRPLYLVHQVVTPGIFVNVFYHFIWEPIMTTFFKRAINCILDLPSAPKFSDSKVDLMVLYSVTISNWLIVLYLTDGFAEITTRVKKLVGVNHDADKRGDKPCEGETKQN